MAATARSTRSFGPSTSATPPTATSSTTASLLRVNELDDEGFDVGVYHSHPRSPAEPSQTDINLASYPHWTYLIVSLENGDAPVVRGWRIADGRVKEEPILVDG